jgi:hypothetical protein
MGLDSNGDFSTFEAAWVDGAANLSIAMAQGVLIERYDVSADRALTMLDDCAQASGLPVVEAARWLLTAGTLP